MKFEQYPIADEIKKSISELGYKRPTDIQFKAIPAIMKGEDVLAIAQTGTGKTAAFAIPILNHLNNQKRSRRSEDIKCLVMVPTRELALQISDAFKQLGKIYKGESLLCIWWRRPRPSNFKTRKGHRYSCCNSWKDV